MVEMGNECGFPSNFDMFRPFTPHKTELLRKTELQPIKSLNGLLYPRVEVEQQTHSGDKIYQHMPNFWAYKMSDFTKQNFQIKVSL